MENEKLGKINILGKDFDLSNDFDLSCLFDRIDWSNAVTLSEVSKHLATHISRMSKNELN
jgi:hypothetical protein